MTTVIIGRLSLLAGVGGLNADFLSVNRVAFIRVAGIPSVTSINKTYKNTDCIGTRSSGSNTAGEEMPMIRMIILVAVAGASAGCNPVQKNAQLVSGAAGQHLSAGPGDTVMDVRITKSLPNAFGGADVFGRTTDAGRVIVQYVGSQGKMAQFMRQNTIIETNETTMTRTPLIIPNTQTTTLNGMVGNTSVSGTATTQGYSVIGSRSPQGYATSAPAIPISVQEGRSVTMEGRTLQVLRVAPEGIEYTLN